jgi:hypothetical protein
MYPTRSFLLLASILSLSLASGCGSLYGLTFMIPSVLSGEWGAYENAQREFDQQVANLPSATVQVVNPTSVAVDVTLEAGMNGPNPPVTISDYPPYWEHSGPSVELYPVDTQTATVAAGATQPISVKCGEVIGISVNALADSVEAPYIPNYGQFGLYISPGNVALRGLGTAGDGDWARFLRPAEDGLDCTAQTLDLTIEAADDGTIAGTLAIAD